MWRLTAALLLTLIGGQKMSTTSTFTVGTEQTGHAISIDGVYSRLFNDTASYCRNTFDVTVELYRSIAMFNLAPLPDCLEVEAATLTFTVTTLTDNGTLQVRVGNTTDFTAITDEALFTMFNETGAVPPVETESLLVAEITPVSGANEVVFSTSLGSGYPLQRIQDAITNNKQLLIGIKPKGFLGTGNVVIADSWSLTLTFTNPNERKPLTGNLRGVLRP